MAHAARIPQIPGTLVGQEQAGWLNEHVARLCHLNRAMFPGSQPVSFDQNSLKMLENEDFWVCEKSDGVRVIVLIAMNKMSGSQDIFLIDRKEEFRQVENIEFRGLNQALLGDTILDGELVIDVDPATGEEILRLYAFDCLVFEGENLFHKPLSKRYGRLKSSVIDPLRKAAPNPARPFDIVLKSMDLSYGVEKVFKEIIPKLQHGHDGLIFTCCDSEYVTGTDHKILKWKPPSDNSIDFKLELRFPPQRLPSGDFSASPDFSAMPVFKLHQWLGGENYEFFDLMTVEEEEWERMKESRVQYDDQVIEVTWEEDRQTWAILRVRDDKPHGNHAKTVQSIITSIQDGVEAEQLFSSCPRIRTAWKARAARPPPPPPQQQQQQQQQQYPQQQQNGGYNVQQWQQQQQMTPAGPPRGGQYTGQATPMRQYQPQSGGPGGGLRR